MDYESSGSPSQISMASNKVNYGSLPNIDIDSDINSEDEDDYTFENGLSLHSSVPN